MNHRPDTVTISNTVYLNAVQMHNTEIVADALSTTPFAVPNHVLEP